ncbi:MAG: asparagine synthase (glutamine-hydrolyzing) [Candidatus Omnitrophica bacterium]|nr:asparagine synthase (glutamine-hydrolyzing) [Candidatus Omnitrophota bacterium]
MCGVVGIFSYHFDSPKVDRDELRQIRDSMKLRGPDGYGEWFSEDGRVGLGHRRLAIIDLSEAGAQPMRTRDGSLIVSFNGEIYNYKELRKDLESKGYVFRSRSDTEVLLHLYAEKGESMVHDLRGMFAFALWDAKGNRMFLARDPYGIKPLYYADDGKTIRVASQVKALLASGKISRTPDSAGAVGFFLFGSIPEPLTTYKEIQELPAGSFMWINPSGVSGPHIYFSIAKTFQKCIEEAQPLRKPEIQNVVRDALLDSVRHHFVADVPVGVFLSSGIDSGSLVGLARDAGIRDVQTVTLTFEELRGTHEDEAPLADMVAKQYGTSHHTYVLKRSEFHEDLPKVFEAMDQPSIDGINTYFVSKAAAHIGLKVALSGLGGDELFRGYPSFREIPRMVRNFSMLSRIPYLGEIYRYVYVNFLARILPLSPKAGGLLKYGGDYAGAYFLKRGLFMPWELSEILNPEVVREGLRRFDQIDYIKKAVTPDPKTPFARVASMESTLYMRTQLLRDADWAGMAHSLEIRTPYVDVGLLRALGGVLAIHPKSNGKHLMAQSPSVPLPQAVIRRAKTGFTVPISEWLQAEKDPDTWRGLPILARKSCHWSRRWAFTVSQRYKVSQKKIRVLALFSDAFGGHGGIAQFNRDFLNALCGYPDLREVVAIPRVMRRPAGALPDKLTYITAGRNSKFKYMLEIVKKLSHVRNYDLILCGHINLLPIAYLGKLLNPRAPLVLIIYGIDAWQPHKSWLTNYLTQKIDAFIAVSNVTKERFLRWTELDDSQGYVLPSCVDLNYFKPGPKPQRLIEHYGLKDKTVLMTLGRLATAERYKGFDEVLEILPDLSKEIPNIVYLIAGDGTDRQRLEEKAKRLGIRDQVVFTGFIPESEKADHYRLADVYVMPSRGEGFGIVFLEAMACGIPVIASKADGSREAVRNGTLGILVDPEKLGEIKAGIREALKRPLRAIPKGLDYFSYENFRERLFAIVSGITKYENTRACSV